MKKLINKFKETYTGRDIIVSLQHMLTMLGGTILVPISCGMNISITMLCAGIGTIAFFFITQKKVPVFLGSSFAFLAAYQNIMGQGIDPLKGETLGNLFETNYSLWCTNMGKLVVALFIAGLLYGLFSILIKFVGVEKIKKAFSPIVVGPVVMLIGFILCQSMFKNDIYNQIIGNSSYGVEEAWKVWTCAIVTIITVIGINAYCKPKSIFKIMPIICGFVVGTIYAVIIGYNINISFSGSITVFEEIFCKNSILGFWGKLSLDANALLQILPIAIVSMMEHMGDISANSLACGKDFMVDPGVNRTILGDGTATFIAGLLGGPANTTYSENTAILVMTKNYKPANMFLAAIFSIVLGLFVPFAEIIKAIPTPVIGGASIVLFGMISASGLRTLIENKIDLGKTKNLIVVSFTLAVGLGINAIGNLQLGNIEISALCVATIIAIVLNFLVPDNEEDVEENAGVEKNEGICEDVEQVVTENNEQENSLSIKTEENEEINE